MITVSFQSKRRNVVIFFYFVNVLYLFSDIAFELFSKVEPVKERHLAEIKYKTGLCHYAAMAYDESIADLQKSADYMQKSIDSQKQLEPSPAVEQLIDDLTKTREDIIIKMADVQETKQLVIKFCAFVFNQKDFHFEF